MEENQKQLLERILIILKQCDPSQEKTLTTANNLITYIKYTHAGELKRVPDTYKEFALQMKHHYPELKKLKTNQEKLDFLKKIVEECNTALV